MDVIIMRSITWLIKNISSDYPQFAFREADDFWWSAAEQTVYYNSESDNCPEFCLHELSHALLDHRGYIYDIDLIKLERDAWDYAANELAPRYKLTLDDEIIQNNLDTYRTWLHARSTCPNCNATGLQIKELYRCIACNHTWRANEARVSALRRYSLQTK